jgi:hypothetical protein
MSDTNSDATVPKKDVQEKSLERMEALLKQSALGFHVLFDNRAIARALGTPQDQKEFFDFNKMKRIQDVMTELIAKPTYYEKLAYLQDLDEASHQMLIRTYFHIVENNVRANSNLHH